MTISRSDSAIPQEQYHLADVDDHADVVRCPVCGAVLERLRTPQVPPRLLEDGGADVVARAYICGRHRREVVALEPAAIAPETFVPVAASLDGETARIAVPAPVAEREGVA